jgi:SAM-dependent methyltransferase
MRPPPEFDALNRFTGLAAVYARCRPAYPEVALSWLAECCGLGPGCLLIDVGSGTGIASRQFAARGITVLGIEPNADMRTRAEAEPVPSGTPPPAYRDGRAEATGLPERTADAVLAAQAFHWFQPAAALAEFHRVLKPGGWVILLSNERDESDPFTAAYGQVIRSGPGAAAVEDGRLRSGAALLTSPLFVEPHEHFFANEQVLGEEEMVGRALSVSYAPREVGPRAQFVACLRAAFARHQKGGRVTIRYRTSVTVARRPPEPPPAA